MTDDVQTITYFGEKVTYTELARRSGINDSTLRSRWERGLRDADLTAPPDAAQSERSKKVHLAAVRRREQLELERRKRQDKQRAQRDAIRWARQELDRVANKPLISASLLTPAERRSILDRVRCSGQRSWGLKGLAI